MGVCCIRRKSQMSIPLAFLLHRAERTLLVTRKSSRSCLQTSSESEINLEGFAHVSCCRKFDQFSCSRFFCQDDKLCQNGGIYVSKRCQRKRHSGGDPKCALMLTDFPGKATFTPVKFIVIVMITAL